MTISTGDITPSSTAPRQPHLKYFKLLDLVYSYLDLTLEALLLINKCAKQASLNGGTNMAKKTLKKAKKLEATKPLTVIR